MLDKTKYDWSKLQGVDDITVGRYFEHDDDAKKQFQKWLSFLQKPDSKVLEIGSGSGFFTNILLNLFDNIKLTCLEPDETFVETLKNRFKEHISIVNEPIETTTIPSNSFDYSISHIVIHNLLDPVVALQQMSRVVKSNGKIITIDPLPASRHYYPSEEITKAFDFLEKAVRYKCMERMKDKEDMIPRNPWTYFYPKFFEEVGLKNITCYGWTSVFTISDTRYDFSEKKKWFKLRYDLAKKQQAKVRDILLRNNENEKEIDEAYGVVFDYYNKLVTITEKELKQTHEQEIVHRIITIGEKP